MSNRAATLKHSVGGKVSRKPNKVLITKSVSPERSRLLNQTENITAKELHYSTYVKFIQNTK